MGLCTWVGGDVGNEDDWTVAANWAPAAVPINADDVIFNSGDEDCETAGADRSATLLGTFTVTDGYEGSIGTVATPLDLKIDADYVYLEINAASKHSLAVVNCTLLVQTAGSDDDALHLGDEIASTIVDVALLGGHAVLDDVTISQGLIIDDPAVVSLSVNTSYVDLNHMGGTTTSLCAVVAADTRTTMSGGKLTKTDGSDRRILMDGGTFVWNASGHTITYADVLSGFFDASGDDTLKTITHPILGRRGEMNLRNEGTDIACTNPIVDLGGTLKVNRGQLVTLT